MLACMSLGMWELIAFGVCTAIMVFGGGALLLVGGKFIVKTPRATYWRSVLAMLVGVLGSVALICFSILGLVVGLFWTWLVIRAFFKISFGKSILAWLPVLGLQLLLGTLFVNFVLAPSFQRSMDYVRSVVSASNLSGIGKGISLYKTNNDDFYPPSLNELIEDGEVSEKMLRHPSVSIDGPRSYFYLPPKNGKDVDGSILVACEKKGLNKSRKGRNVLFTGGLSDTGVVKFLSPEEFTAELAKPHNAAFAAALKQAEGL